MLDLEPHGPLPTEIYWRRRGLAVGIAVVVIGIVLAAVIAFMGNSTGAKPASADKPNSGQSKPGAPAPQAPPPAGQQGATPAAPPQQGQNPETPTPTAAVQPPPVLKEGDDCPDSTLAVKGLT
ncbi:MAG: hypothetical protein WAO15_04875, partial [Mycobacterium sp.]